MPKKTEQELKQVVEAGEVAGFTPDTTEFHHVGYNFQSKILKAPGQFTDTDVTHQDIPRANVPFWRCLLNR